MNKKGGWGEWGGGSMWVHSPVVKIEAITVNFMKKNSFEIVGQTFTTEYFPGPRDSKNL